MKFETTFLIICLFYMGYRAWIAIFYSDRHRAFILMYAKLFRGWAPHVAKPYESTWVVTAFRFSFIFGFLVILAMLVSILQK